MKITIDVPEWAEGKNLYVLAGVELLAFKRFDSDKLHTKVVRCNMCGKCCMDIDDGINFPFPVVNERCVYLTKLRGKDERYVCGLGPYRPFACCSGDPNFSQNMDECCITHTVSDIGG